MHHRFLALATGFALIAFGSTATAFASSQPVGPPAPTGPAFSEGGNLRVTVSVNRVKATQDRTSAKGVAVLQLRDFAGNTQVLRQPVTLTVKRGGNCRILTLVLDELTLNLLGLNVHLDKVNLQITGKPNGGVLGSLFCRLARAKVKAGKVAAARALNAHLSRKPMRAIAFTVPVTPKATTSQAPPGSCQVLDLVLGPLHLDLLGLVVDLNRVHLVITATRGQGVLGDLFCSLAGGVVPVR